MTPIKNRHPERMAKTNMLRLLLLVAGLKASIATQTLSECKKLNGSFHRENEELEKVATEMWQKYDETCDTTDRCVLEVGDQVAVTRLTYMNMRGTEQYDAVKKACQDLSTDDAPTTLCRVNSELEVPGDERNVMFFAKREPVCFAYACSEKQAEMVEKAPLGCDPTTHNCIIHSEDADCGTRPDGAGQGNCKLHQKAIDEDPAYSEAKDALNIAAGSYCKQTEDESNAICEYEVKPIQITVGENFRTFENDETFLRYTDACYDAGGQTCYMSLNSKIVGEVVVFNLDVTGDYNDFPVCFPAECAHEDREAIAKEHLATNMANKISDALGDFVVRRRLSGESVEEMNVNEMRDHLKQRLLATNSDGETCPLGMKECEANVVDFFCTGRDGIEVDIVKLTASPATTISNALGTFLTATLLAKFLFL